MDSGNMLAGTVDYLKEALAAVNEQEKLCTKRDALEDEEKGLEREIAGEERACSSEIEQTLRKRKEEIASSFDREIRGDQDKVRKVRAEREKAKDKGVAGRIEAETAGLREENKKIQEQIREVLKSSRLPRFCNTKLYFGIFSPKNVIEYLIFVVTFLVATVLLPILCFLIVPAAVKNPYVMLAICFVWYLLFFVCYQLIVRRTKVDKWQTICQVRALRGKIHANHKKIKAVKNVILKDKNEQSYHLEEFDEELKGLETEILQSMEEKKEALAAFETSTSAILAEEIRGRYAEKLNKLKSEKAEVEQYLKDVDTEIKDINKYITANFEAFLGKDYVTERALQAMIAIMEENRASTVAEALALYKEEH
ncbi:MAG: hypothetical protein J6J86_08535 [Lachnospiraceae bacterium]|nr:hypothetical protein [Lachnospiraceae bacterium]